MRSPLEYVMINRKVLYILYLTSTNTDVVPWYERPKHLLNSHVTTYLQLAVKGFPKLMTSKIIVKKVARVF